MSSATIALSTATELDIEASRQLGDYARLDDEDVERAVEQVHVQRYGRVAMPFHRQRITHLAAVIDDGETIRPFRADSSSEPNDLRALFAAWPQADTMRLVDWSGDGWALLAARALRHGLVLPVGYDSLSCKALMDCVTGRFEPTIDADQLEWESLTLMTDLELDDDLSAPAMRAAGRYQLWLQWQYITGYIASDELTDCQTRLANAMVSERS